MCVYGGKVGEGGRGYIGGDGVCVYGGKVGEGILGEVVCVCMGVR